MTNLAAAVELVACPFCGGSAKIEIRQGSWGYYPEAAWVECTQCGVKTRSYNDDEKTKDGHKILAADKWNQRPPVAGLAVDGTELFKALKKVHDADGTYDDMDKAVRQFLGKVDG